ncbi:single-stranded DNA-binding protein [uncultured Brachyspira sp.]|uniref:single-stranded DNA-binding protein n=1 Tax=uncultured Brachyspira sp. TaxID=221953 RepID=UPI0026037FBD|nr:single-stranded DNA-binding protein [uncultured Brachyspira sp.]
MSGNANIIVVEGRLTRDPSYIKTKNGKSLCKFSIANNRYYYVNGSLQKEVYFFDLIAWGYTAEKVAVNLLKGRHILVNGELRQNSYIAKDGSRKNSIYILALEVKSLDKKTIEKNNYYNSANNQIVSDVIEESLEQAF